MDLGPIRFRFDSDSIPIRFRFDSECICKRTRELLLCHSDPASYRWTKKLCTLLDLCVSSLRRGHANLLCIVPILTDDPRRESENTEHKSRWTTGTQLRKTQSQPKLRRLPGSFPEISRKLPRHRLGRLYTVWAGCTQSGPTVRSLGRLYTVWADCRFF